MPDGPDGPGGQVVRVVICDDHELFRRGLAMVLDGEQGVEVVGVASDGAEAVGMVAELEPDVVLLDLRMPGTDGVAAARSIVTTSEAVRVLTASLTRGRRPAHVPRTSLSTSGSVTEWLTADSR